MTSLTLLIIGCTGLAIIEDINDSGNIVIDSPENQDTGLTDQNQDSTEDSEPTERDFDGDGYSVEDGDCNDLNPDIHPFQNDKCDGVDNNCDGNVDEGAIGAMYEPNDAPWNGYDLGQYSAGDSVNVQGIISEPTDSDNYQLYVEEGWFEDFTIEFELIAQGARADFTIELWLVENGSGDREDLLLSVNNLSAGGIERGKFNGDTWKNDSGFYEFRIAALSAQDCDAIYELDILLTP